MQALPNILAQAAIIHGLVIRLGAQDSRERLYILQRNGIIGGTDVMSAKLPKMAVPNSGGLVLICRGKE